MAFDEATETSLASRAYERAVAVANAKKRKLQIGYGLMDDGTLDPTNRLGSIYQTNLQSSRAMTAAADADRRRGFGDRGFGGKLRSQARTDASDRQALALQGAMGDLSDVTQEKDLALHDYEDTKTRIRSTAAMDLAETLRQQQLYGAGGAVPGVVPASAPVGIPPAVAAAQIAALKRNPRAAQVARNNRL